MSTGHDPSFNPYSPPTHAPQGQWAQTHGPSSVSPAILESLRKTRPWVMLIAILGAIGVGFMVLGGLAMMATVSGVAGFFYLVFAGVYSLPLISMFRYSSAIDRLLHGGGQPELEQAVAAQQSFWQVLGIFTLIGMVLSFLFIIGMVAFAASFDGLQRF